MDHHRVIVDLASTAEQRIQAAFQLLVENSPASVKLLQQSLISDPSPIVRHECAYSLGELSNDEGFVGLITAIETDPNHFVVHEAALALANLGVEDAREPLTNLLDHDDPNVVLTAEISLQRLEMNLNNLTLGSLGLDPASVILDDSSLSEHRIQASFQLMEDGSHIALDRLIEALHQEQDPIVKHEIIFALGESASSAVIPHLIDEMRTDSNVFVRHEAALALGTLGNLEAEPAIRELLDDPDPDIVESAEIALERLRS